MKPVILTLLLACGLAADGPGRIVSHYSERDFELTADPTAPHWRSVEPTIAENGKYGEKVPGNRTEIRSRWTRDHLYVLFTCHYERLHVNINPSTTRETNQLWNHDVAEVFVGADFKNIHLYREYQVSPLGEWVDLAVDRSKATGFSDWTWNSGYTVKARLDRDAQVWWGEMKIPLRSIASKTPEVGDQMRINFYRLQGPPPNRAGIAWQPVNAETYHTPAAFGRLVFGK